jgi:hypothetical protein
MKSESKNENNKRNHSIVSLATFFQKKLKNPGLLQRFLNWIARGAVEWHMDRTSCPS